MTSSDRSAPSESNPRATEALRPIDADYQSIFENANVGLYRSALDGRLVRANPALAMLNGYANEAEMLEDLRHNGNEWYVDPGRRAEFHRLMAQQQSVRDFVSQVYRMKSRERIWVSEKAWTVRGPDGRTLFYEGVVEDITDRVKADAELAAARIAAEAASEAKSTFLAVMSHELRSPLNAIIGFSEIIANRIYGPHDPRYFDYAEDIHASGTQLLSLIEDILDMSKIGAGHMQLRETAVSVPNLATSVLRLFAANASKAQLALTMQFPDHYPVLRGDPVRLKQVLTNLVANAVKFTPPGGSVMVGGDQTADAVRFWVADTGPGMTPEECARAVEPFVQVHDSMTVHMGGTGLGLPISRDLIALHDGTLTLDSAKGAGTRVIVALPRSRMV